MKRMTASWTAGLAMVLAASAAAAAAPDSGGPYSLTEGSWVCHTPEQYQGVLAARQAGEGVRDIEKRTRESSTCIYLDDDNLEDMMAPFVQVLERSGELVKVSFIIEHYRRVGGRYLHRQFTRMEYKGWTGAGNVVSYYPEKPK